MNQSSSSDHKSKPDFIRVLSNPKLFRGAFFFFLIKGGFWFLLFYRCVEFIRKLLILFILPFLFLTELPLLLNYISLISVSYYEFNFILAGLIRLIFEKFFLFEYTIEASYVLSSASSH